MTDIFHEFFETLKRGAPVTVCQDCVKLTDEKVSLAGDYACCDRCNAPVNSQVGFMVRPKDL